MTLGSIETFQSVGKAALVNGTFSVYGFISTSVLRWLFSSNFFNGKPMSRFLLTGGTLSLIFTWGIVVFINFMILSFQDISVTEAGITRLFRGTFKFLFVFLGWTGLYLAGEILV